MVGVEDQLLREIADPVMTRDDVALTYAFALVHQEGVDFPRVNRAILERWSMAALHYVKGKAWKHVRCRECG